MKFLFSHRNFPAQFRHVLIELSKDSNNEIVFITGTENDTQIRGVKKLLYKTKREVPKDCHRYLRLYEDAIIHGQAAAEVAIALKKSGFVPDIIYAHPWGNSTFFKDIFPKSYLINFCEWYYNSQNSDVDFIDKQVPYDRLAMTRCRNAQIALDMLACDKGISPTYWQKSQFPKDLQHKIEVLHDGIDTDYFVPNPDAVLKIPNSNIELSTKDEVITYATRGMEPYRGFPQFMEMTEKLLKKRPRVHVVIGGEDRVCYGAKLAKGTYKEIMLNKLNLDMSRVHFTGSLPYIEYKKLLQISSAHVYLTYPFVLSWSILEAMSCGCCIIGSQTAPVEEVIKDNENGLLVDFFDIEALVSKIEYTLDNQDKVSILRENARKTIVDNYDLKKMLPKHIEIIKNYASTSL